MSDDGNGNPPSWDDLVNQVQSALEELNLNSPENQALFVEGLKEVMDSLDEMGFDLGFPHPGTPLQKKPDIQVFEGGKKEAATAENGAKDDSEPRIEDADSGTEKGEKKQKKSAKNKKRPDLKVAPPEPDNEGSSDTTTEKRPNLPPFVGFPPTDPASLRAMFKVLRMGEETPQSTSLSPLEAQGKIHLKKDGIRFQNVFRGETARTYRIECRQGGLQIYLNGKPAEEIQEGQCTDVEAAVIRVQASNDDDAEGLYARLRD